jgi:curved DNA-binding protein CbpA
MCQFIHKLDNKGYYAILGVPKQAKYQEIKAAYRRLVKNYHPDVGHNDSHNSLSNEDMIRKINAAYEVLSDKDKRNEYDRQVVHNDGVEDDSNDNELQQDNKADIVNDDARTVDKSDSDSSSSKNKKHSSKYYKVYPNFKNYNKVVNGNHTYVSSQTQEAKSSSSSFSSIKGSNSSAKGPFHIIVEPSLCMAFGSCEKLAPRTFVVEKDIMFNPKAKIISETTEGEDDFDAILAAAETCPTKAIIIIDRYTGRQIYP